MRASKSPPIDPTRQGKVMAVDDWLLCSSPCGDKFYFLLRLLILFSFFQNRIRIYMHDFLNFKLVEPGLLLTELTISP